MPPTTGVALNPNTFEGWADLMETGIRDPFKRIFSPSDEMRDVYLTRNDRLFRPAWEATPEGRFVIQRKLDRIKEQQHELRSLRSLYEFRLRDLPEPSPDQR